MRRLKAALLLRMPRGSLGVETMDTTARARDSSPPSISTIGEDLTITGNVTSKGELHANGRVQGDVHCYVEGNPFHKSLSLEQGTQFEGESRVPRTIRYPSQKFTSSRTELHRA